MGLTQSFTQRESAERYDFYSNPTEAHGRLSAIPNPATDSGPTVGKVFAGTPRDRLSPQAGFAWNIFGDGKTVLRGGGGIFRDQLPVLRATAPGTASVEVSKLGLDIALSH